MSAAGRTPDAVVAEALQDLAATRLGRGFRPLSMLFVLGVAGVVMNVPGALLVASGAVFSAAVLLALAMRTVQRVMGRPDRVWMSLVDLASFVPPLYGVFLVGWRGLRGVGVAAGPAALFSAILHAALGVWVLRCWLQVAEIERLAHVMAANVDSTGEQSD